MMKNMTLVSILLLLIQITIHANQNETGDSTDSHIAVKDELLSAITFQRNGGRFGDNLESYARVEWLSFKYGIPARPSTFKYLNRLVLYDKRKRGRKEFKKIVRLPQSGKFELKKNESILYINHWRVPVRVDWHDQDFIAVLKELIAPRFPIEKIVIPEGFLSVAVHVRKGGDFAADTEQEKKRCPLRFVPDKFYIDQIKRLTTMFPDKKLYVYIFTDDPNPKKIAAKFNKVLDNAAITFDYNKNENGHNIGVVEDFFCMMDFECLIRPGSHFSRFVERLGAAQWVIYPDCHSKKKNKLDMVCIKNRTKNGWKMRKETYAL
jgi:hypothetical protein